MVRPAVDLPQPDSPTRPKVSPLLISKEIPSTACTAPTWRCSRPRLIGKCLTKFSIVSKGWLGAELDIASLSFSDIPPAGNLVVWPDLDKRRVFVALLKRI